MKFHVFLMLIIVLISAACSAKIKDEYKQITEADDRMVTSCEFLGEVDGEGGIEGLGGLRTAKINAINMAGDRGATHIVWRTLHPGNPGRPFASGRAYKCPPATSPAPAPQAAVTQI